MQGRYTPLLDDFEVGVVRRQRFEFSRIRAKLFDELLVIVSSNSENAEDVSGIRVFSRAIL